MPRAGERRGLPRQRELVLTKTMVVETNHVCNLRCIHCYVPGDSKRTGALLDRGLAEDLFDQFEEMGFRYVLLTGGEPLVHPEFEEIYRSAWDRGFYVSLFTNGLLLDRDRLDLLTDRPPAVVRISLFGGSPDSYASVAGRPGYEKALDGILELHARGLPVRVKVPLLRQNADDVSAALSELRGRGIPCKVDVRIIPRFDRDTEILRWRLPPEEIVELGLESRRLNLEKHRALRKRPPDDLRTLRYCLERCQPFIINPEGKLQLCFFLRDRSLDLHGRSLREAILGLAEAMLDDEVDHQAPACGACSRSAYCGYCPGWAKNEVGRAGEPIPFLCRLTELFDAKYRELEHSPATEATTGGHHVGH